MIGISAIFRTVQGEGVLLGVPMVFVRTSGCSVGCALCDTDYRLRRRMSIADIVSECHSIQSGGWVWVTGGEPTDWPMIGELSSELRLAGFKSAIATSGVRDISGCWDFVSVSPHDPGKWAQRSGDQLNIVPGLNDYSIESFAEQHHDFKYRFVTPCDGKPETLQLCIDFAVKHNWRLGVQAHKVWGLR